MRLSLNAMPRQFLLLALATWGGLWTLARRRVGYEVFFCARLFHVGLRSGRRLQLPACSSSRLPSPLGPPIGRVDFWASVPGIARSTQQASWASVWDRRVCGN